MPTFQILKCERILQELAWLAMTLFSVSDTLRHLLIIYVTFQNTEESEIIISKTLI